MATKRTDPHRKGAIIPGHYRYLTSYYLGGLSCPPIGMDVLRHLRAERPFFQVPGRSSTAGRCDACGACFSYGDVWVHEPSGECIHLGQDCAQKYGLLVDRSAFELECDRERAARAVEVQRVINDERRQRFLAAHEGLAADLDVDHHIVADIKRRFVQYCELSEAQVALVRKIANEVRNPTPREAEPPKAQVPAGRVVVEGIVLATKWVETDFGESIKMLVQVTLADGSAWKCWGTAPSSLLGQEAPLKGSRVRFSATLQPKELGFGFFSRPTKAERLG